MTYPECLDRAKVRAAELADRLNEVIYVIQESAQHVDRETGADHGPYGLRDASELTEGVTLVHTAHPQPPRTDPAAVETLKQAIVALINARRHAQAEHLADRGCDDMDPETAEEFVSWCAEVGIR